MAVVLARLTAALGSVAFAFARSAEPERSLAARRVDPYLGLAAAATGLILLAQEPSWLQIRLSP